MLEVGMHEAKTRLSELVKLAQKGERICLTNRGKIVAEITLPQALRRRNAAAAVRRLKKLVQEHPLGTFDEMMAWRREGLK